jgi:hypothetical protein
MTKSITAQAEPLTGIDKVLSLEKGCDTKTSQAQRALLNDIQYDSIVQAHCDNDAVRVGITLIMARKLTMDLPPLGDGKSTSYWFNVGHNENTPQGKLVSPVKRIVFDQLKARKHSNPSTAWAQYRAAGAELVFGKKIVKTGGAGAGSRARKFDDRVLEEGAKLWLAYNTPSTGEAIKDLSTVRQERIAKAAPLIEQLLVAITGVAGIAAKLLADRDAAK